MSTRKQVWQYRCDFCKKHNLSASSIAKHEKHCTMNPARICRMCAAGNISDEQKTISELVSCLSLDKQDYGIAELQDLAQSCPACILAAIRQSKIRETYRAKFASDQDYFEARGPLDLKWDFKEAVKEFWSEVNSAQAEAGSYDPY